MIVWMEYRVKGYSIADALRPDPFWGKRQFSIDTDLIGTDDMREIEQAARATAPDGYELNRIEEYKNL